MMLPMIHVSKTTQERGGRGRKSVHRLGKDALWVALALSAAGPQTACRGGDSPFGRFEGELKTSWADDGRTMHVLAPFKYFDPSGLEWAAGTDDVDSVIDGASIPRVFWSLIGGPFEGKYRNASVVHDAACRRRHRRWQDVHTMFYNACRCGGEGEIKAKIMYAAVYHFGPRWSADMEPDTVMTDAADSVRLQRLIAENPMKSLDELARLTPASLRAAMPVAPHGDDVTGEEVLRKLLGRWEGHAELDPGRTTVFVKPPARVADTDPNAWAIERRGSALKDLERDQEALERQLLAENDPARRKALAARYVQLLNGGGTLQQVRIELELPNDTRSVVRPMLERPQ